MNAKKIAVLAIVTFALLCIIPAEDSDADVAIGESGRSSTFDNMNGGSVWCNVVNNASETQVIVKVTEKSNGNEIGSNGPVTIPAASEDNPFTKVSVSLSDYKSVGEHMIVISVYDTDNILLDSTEMTLVVDDNILSNWTTFAVIIIVVIVIAIIAYLRIRDNHSKNEASKMTFEELEAQRKAEMAMKSEKKAAKAQTPSTERRKYEKK